MEGGKLRSVILYYLLHAIRELGISMPLLFRRITETASKDIDYISKEFFGGAMHTENFEQLVRDFSEMLKREGLVEDIVVNFGDEGVELDVIGCAYLDMAAKAKAEGRTGCPVCLISLAASIASTVAKNHAFNLSEYESDVDNRKCKLKVSHTK